METGLTVNIDLLKRGDKSEYEKIYHDFSGVLFSLSCQYINDQMVAEEIVQETFLKLWEVKEALLPGTNIRNFLYTIAKNHCLNHLRDQQTAWKHLSRIQALEYQYAIESLNRMGDTYTEFEELQKRVNEAIAALPNDLREVFTLNRFEELRYKDIAQKLGVSEKTVEARMSKALRILRAELKDYLPLLYMISNLFF